MADVHSFFRDILRARTKTASDEHGPNLLAPSELAAAQADLGHVADDEWAWQAWFDHASTWGHPVIGVRDPRASEIVGFCSIEADADRATEHGSRILEIEIVSVYVRKDYRGKGYGAALGLAAAQHLRNLVDRIASIPEEDMDHLGLEGLMVRVSYFPESDEGHAFGSRIACEVDRHLAALAGAAWFGTAVFCEETQPVQRTRTP